MTTVIGGQYTSIPNSHEPLVPSPEDGCSNCVHIKKLSPLKTSHNDIRHLGIIVSYLLHLFIFL